MTLKTRIRTLEGQKKTGLPQLTAEERDKYYVRGFMTLAEALADITGEEVTTEELHAILEGVTRDNKK